MEFTYDPRYNVAYIRFGKKPGKVEVETIRVSEELNIDLAPNGTVYGIELLNAETWAEIRRLYFVEGLSKRKIAGMMKMDKKTISRAIKMEEYKMKRTVSGNRLSKLDPYKKDIAELI